MLAALMLMFLQEPAKMTKLIKTYVFNKNYRGYAKTFQEFITHNDKQVHKTLLLVLNLSVNNIIYKCKLLFHINRSTRLDLLRFSRIHNYLKKFQLRSFYFLLGPPSIVASISYLQVNSFSATNIWKLNSK